MSRLLLLRDPPADGHLSMDRYADMVGDAMRAAPGWEVEEMAVRLRSASPRAAGWAVGQYDRFVRYPAAAGRRRADVFHIVDQGFGHLAAFLPKERTVVTCHDLVTLRAGGEGDAGWTARPTARARFAWSVGFLRRVACVVCVSEVTQRDVVELLGVPVERTVVIPNPIAGHFGPGDPAAAQARRRALGADGGLLVLHASSGHPYKNNDGVLRTVAELHRRGEPVTLARTGRALEPAHEQLARELGIADRIADLGRVSDADLAELYRAADVVLHPSHWEGFGWPPLESMASGTPVVVSTAPALLEVAGDAALSAPATATERLADHVQALHHDRDLRARLVGRGLQRAAGYTHAQTRERLVAVYRSITAAA